MIMRSESKEIYGVGVFPVLAVLHQIHKQRILRSLRKNWNWRNRAVKACHRAKRPDLVRFFNIEHEYFFIRTEARRYQREGVI